MASKEISIVKERKIPFLYGLQYNLEQLTTYYISMRKFSFLVSLSFLILFIGRIETKAQSQVWAGGYIEIDYVGDEKYPMSLPLDWDNNNFINYSKRDFGGASSNFVVSPTQGGNRVLATQKLTGSQATANTQLGNKLSSPIPFATGQTTMMARIYSPLIGSVIRLRAENSSNPSEFVETEISTATANSWETLPFDFSSPVATSPALDFNIDYDVLYIYYNYGVLGQGNTYYLDSLYLDGAAPDNYRDLPQPYQVTLHFYRDNIPNGVALTGTKTVTISSKSLNISQNLVLDRRFNEGPVVQYCLNNSRVLTEGALYQNTSPVVLPPARDWVISFSGEARSSEYNNVRPAQLFYIETLLNNFYVGAITGFQNGSPNRVFNPRKYNSAELVNTDPVASFLVGKRYTYQVPLFDQKNNDILSYEFANARAENATTALTYLQPAYPFDQPLPIEGQQLILDRSSGTMAFTPSTRFTSLVTFKINEQRRVYYNDAATNTILAKDTFVNTTFYESRFIFDDDGNSRLPDFEGVEAVFDPSLGEDRYVSTYNSVEDAFEFDCGTDTLTFNLSEPLLCSYIDKTDFRIGLGYDRMDTLAAFINEAYYAYITPTEPVSPIKNRMRSCSSVGEFNQVTLILHKPLGPGEYNIFFRYGSNDSTTIKNKCDYELPINQPYVKVYINDDFTYDHPIEDHTYCFPAVTDKTPNYPVDSAFQTNAQFDPRVFYTWKMDPLDPLTPIDTIYNTEISKHPNDGKRWAFHDISIPRSTNPNARVNTVTWQVGVGLDYSVYHPNTGALIRESICYDTDIFRVTRYENPPVEIPDYDLCPEDDFPIIDLEKHVVNDGAIASQITFSRLLNTFSDIPTAKDWANPKDWLVISSGRSSLALPGQEVNKFNVFATTVPFNIAGHTCYERDTFRVVKNQVIADLYTESNSELSSYSVTDTTICPNAPFNSVQIAENMFPDSMEYKWFQDGNLISGANDSVYSISDEGTFLIEVTKRSAFGSTCDAKDSIRVYLADKLDSMNAACRDISFKDGSVIQNFNWDVAPGADGYEVRGITPGGDSLPWEEANGLYGIQHKIIGQQMKLQVRAYNNEVPDGASCKYGPIITAEACDAIVRPINVFTPNGDGINDYLAFTLLELYPGSLLQVFNRWGEKVFEDNNYYNDWDGEDLKAGTYFYILKINDVLYPEPFKGTFTIIR